ncbi:major facilitator superfamily MFS-1 [Melanomma pulvis-pyrius CBS 109.77]|uniref:Major facilitator superfamily MFS-1 n=1 Tax=Melanomma pulvis-pyrius CBS 109.77 TaxID=1314802 RepID=A0A6A6X5G8_9PLEO|nr:major facilitator superfamily MFS-1 [Melanomma pulvis-pyrius CBS 109.77]
MRRIFLALFISQMESSVTSTAVLAITNDLGGYEKSSWLFTAYLLTYSGFPIIWAKLSDIVGRRTCLLTALILFLIFSAACGAAQTMIQLIMFRWVKGVGGSGIYSLGTLVFWELLPPERWATNASIVTGVLALSLVAGPLIGGAITESGKWRWIFLINVPIIAVASALLLWSFPRRLFNEPAAQYVSETRRAWLSPRQLRRIDVLGGALMLGLCLLLSTGLQQAALGLSWASAYVLPLLIVAGISIIGFLAWSWYVTNRRIWPEPIFPWRFIQNRVCLGMIANAFLAGMILSVTIVQLPQRFMTVNGLYPLAAGVRLLPFGAFVPTGSSIAVVLMDRFKIPPTFICVAGAILEIIGLVFLSRASGSSAVEASQYGSQIVTAVGNGFVNTAVILMIPYVVDNRDLGVGNATMAQFRILGGTIGISITTAAFAPFVKNQLLDGLSASVVHALLDRTGAIGRLPEATQSIVRHAFADGYNLQMKILIGIAAAHIPATLLMWRKRPIIISMKGAERS